MPSKASAPPASRASFDNVCDYAGLNDNGARDARGQAIAALANYRVQVAVTPQAWAGLAAGLLLRWLVTQLRPDAEVGETELLLIDLGQGRNRLGGSALAQVFNQTGATPPDLAVAEATTQPAEPPATRTEQALAEHAGARRQALALEHVDRGQRHRT